MPNAEAPDEKEERPETRVTLDSAEMIGIEAELEASLFASPTLASGSSGSGLPAPDAATGPKVVEAATAAPKAVSAPPTTSAPATSAFKGPLKILPGVPVCKTCRSYVDPMAPGTRLVLSSAMMSKLSLGRVAAPRRRRGT